MITYSQSELPFARPGSIGPLVRAAEGLAGKAPMPSQAGCCPKMVFRLLRSIAPGLRPAAVFIAAFAAVSFISGCSKFTDGIFARWGVNLSVTQKEGQQAVFNAVTESTSTKASDGQVRTISSKLLTKVRCTNVKAEENDWMLVSAEILEGQLSVDGRARPFLLLGQKLSFKHSNTRRISQWRSAGPPVGVELLDISFPKGRVKKGEKWKIETRRLLLELNEEAVFDKFYSLEGEGKLGETQYHRLVVSIPEKSLTLPSGVTLGFSGSGEVWIAKKDKQVLKATEILQGQIGGEKGGKEVRPFSQASAIALESAGVDSAAAVPQPLSPIAPSATGFVQPVQSSATAVDKPAAAAAPAPGGAPAPLPAKAADSEVMEAPKPVEAPVGKIEERIVFINSSTGKRQIWSVLPDGSGKMCLTLRDLDYEHWNPIFDPAGKGMLVVSRRDGAINIWNFDLTSSSRLPATDFGEDEDINLGWCSDGRRLLFARGGSLWNMHRDGFNLQTLEAGGKVLDFSSVFSASKVAAVVSVLNQRKVVELDVISGKRRDLFEGGLPAWSPSGARIAHRGEGTINLAQADGTGDHPVYAGDIADARLCWSANGTKLGFTVMVEGVANVVVLEGVDQDQGVAAPGGAVMFAGRVLKVTTRGGVAQTFSPTADRIAYILHGDLWVATLDGKIHIQITHDGVTTGPVFWGKHYAQ